MRKTSILLSRKYVNHKTGHSHPESSERIKVIIESLKKSEILNQCIIVKPRIAKIDELKLIHKKKHIKNVYGICNIS